MQDIKYIGEPIAQNIARDLLSVKSSSASLLQLDEIMMTGVKLKEGASDIEDEDLIVEDPDGITIVGTTLLEVMLHLWGKDTGNAYEEAVNCYGDVVVEYKTGEIQNPPLIKAPNSYHSPVCYKVTNKFKEGDNYGQNEYQTAFTPVTIEEALSGTLPLFSYKQEPKVTEDNRLYSEGVQECFLISFLKTEDYTPHLIVQVIPFVNQILELISASESEIPYYQSTSFVDIQLPGILNIGAHTQEVYRIKAFDKDNQELVRYALSAESEGENVLLELDTGYYILVPKRIDGNSSSIYSINIKQAYLPGSQSIHHISLYALKPPFQYMIRKPFELDKRLKALENSLGT